MRAGLLRHQVELQAPTNTAGPDGNTQTWTTYATVPAAIDPATAALVERLIAGTTTVPATHLVSLRYRDDVRSTHRVLFGSRPLYIGGIHNARELNRQLVLACEERQA